MTAYSKGKMLRMGLLAAGLVGALATASVATIVGSDHDFSSEGWSGGRVCVVCHTPHNATADTPLWNHEMTTATYTLYSSQTLQETPGQPGMNSRLCLSCHDGTVAVNSFGGDTGTMFVTGDKNLGTDLADDHPIGIAWKHQTVITSDLCSNCHFNEGTGIPDLPFYAGNLECSTCHDPHDNVPGGDHFLRETMAGSQLCLHCHEK